MRYLSLAEALTIAQAVTGTAAGFAVFHFPERFEQAAADLAGWLADGSLIAPEHVLDGIDRYPEALEFMYRSGNIGKLLVRASA